MSSKEQEQEQELGLPPNLPKWFRFNPTDEEIITHLKLKLMGSHSDLDPYIAEVDLCKWEPSELPSQSKIESTNQEWLFFCRPDYNKSKCKNSRRRTKTGYWKKTGKEPQTKGCIGRKRVLVFYEGPYPGKRTDWVIHEYYHPQPDVPLSQQKPPCVICRLKYDPHKKGVQKADTAESPVSFIIKQTLSFLLDNEMQAPDEMQPPLGADELEKYMSELGKHLSGDTEENNSVTTTDNLSNNSTLSVSSKRSYQDGPGSSDTDTEGVNGRYIRTLVLQVLLVHLLAQRKSGTCEWLKHLVKLYKLVRVKTPYKKHCSP